MTSPPHPKQQLSPKTEGNMMRNKDAWMIGVYGGSGSGKSTKAKALIKSEKRVVVFDSLDEYADEEGYPRFTSLEALGKAMAKNYDKGFRVAYVPTSGQEVVALHQLSLMLMRVFQKGYKSGDHDQKITLVVEEMNQAYPVYALPSEFWGFSELCSRGRHYGINRIGVAQRAAEINTRFRGNVKGFYCFRLSTSNDLRAACELLGNEYKNAIRTLPPHDFLYWEGGTVTEGTNTLN
jgi:hypothetical protein